MTVLRHEVTPYNDVPFLDVGKARVDVLLVRVGLGFREDAVEVRGVRLVLPVMLERVEVGGRAGHPGIIHIPAGKPSDASGVSHPTNSQPDQRFIMHQKSLLVLGAACGVLAAPLEAQETRIYRTPEAARAYSYSLSTGNENRAVIGVTTSTGSARDTLGVLVTSITPGGPAERAGIEEGNRIASVNGVNLKLAPVDVGDWDMASAMSRRLTRELGKLKPGDEAELRVYSSGQTRTLRVKTVASDSLNRRMWVSREALDERAAIGVSLGSTGSRRDTLGILIMGLEDDGPAAKAGLEEGNRIAAINGVDLRVSRDDAGDEYMSSARVRRLHRELEKVKAGDEVTLRVYGDGRTRDVRVKTVKTGDLPRRRTMIFGGAMPPMPPMAPMPPMELEFRRDLEDRAARTFERIAPRVRALAGARVTI